AGTRCWYSPRRKARASGGMVFEVLPDVARGPVRQRADFAQHFARGQLELGGDLEIGAGFRLLAPQAGEPRVVVFERREQRLHFAHPAAAVGRRPVQDSKLRLLLDDGQFGRERDQVQVPFRGELVAKSEGFRKVVARIEEQHGDARAACDQHMHQDDAFGLKAGGDAFRRRAGGESLVNPSMSFDDGVVHIQIPPPAETVSRATRTPRSSSWRRMAGTSRGGADCVTRIASIPAPSRADAADWPATTAAEQPRSNSARSSAAATSAVSISITAPQCPQRAIRSAAVTGPAPRAARTGWQTSPA